MADKIVTLKDKNDNNLYPTAGALLAGLVGTQSIQDGAVTSSKIGWATVKFEDMSVALYSDTGGIVSDITLSDNIENYSALIIQYSIDGQTKSRASTMIFGQTNNNEYTLTTSRVSGSTIYVASCQITTNGNKITITSGGQFGIGFNSTISGAGGTNVIKIEAVTGIR